MAATLNNFTVTVLPVSSTIGNISEAFLEAVTEALNTALPQHLEPVLKAGIIIPPLDKISLNTGSG